MDSFLGNRGQTWNFDRVLYSCVTKFFDETHLAYVNFDRQPENGLILSKNIFCLF